MTGAVAGVLRDVMTVIGCIVVALAVLLAAGYLVALWMEKRKPMTPATRQARTATRPSQVMTNDALDAEAIAMVTEKPRPALPKRAVSPRSTGDPFYADGVTEAIERILREGGHG